MQKTPKIRFAKKEDIPKILEIYTPYIENTTITFEYAVPPLAEFAARVEKISREYPYLVCERDGEIIGYAYAARDRERAAYQWNVQLSVYMRQDCTGMGIGKKFYRTLLEISRLQNVTIAYACITMPNPQSQRLHEAWGFTALGTFRRTGFKQGKWLDVLWFEKTVCTHKNPPAPLLSVEEVPKAALQAVLEEVNQSFFV